jgi:signal transduction histidine kinase
MGRETAAANRATPLEAVEVARLEALRRLSMGAAHALNNAFTTVVGEASFLREEHKGDPAVVEACDAILRELDRCAKLTRALLARRSPPQAGRGEVDLVRLVRDLTPLLRETLGRQKELAVVVPDDLVLVKGEAEALELVALLLVQHGADVAPGTARLRLGVYPGGTEARLELEIEADGLAADAADEFLDAGRSAGVLARNQLVALADLAQRHGGRCGARRAGPCNLVASIVLPVLGA